MKSTWIFRWRCYFFHQFQRLKTMQISVKYVSQFGLGFILIRQSTLNQDREEIKRKKKITARDASKFIQQHFILYVFLPIFLCCCWCWLCSDSSWIEHLIRSALGENEWERCVVGDCRKRDNNSKRFYFQIMFLPSFPLLSASQCVCVVCDWRYLIVCASRYKHTHTPAHAHAHICKRIDAIAIIHVW